MLSWIESEKLERRKLAEFFSRVGIRSFQPTEIGSGARCDGWFSWRNIRIPVEVKLRYFTQSDLFVKYQGKLLIEKKKYDSLQLLEPKRNLYVNFLFGGWVYWWWLPRKEEIVWEWQFCNAHTVGFGGQKHRTRKLVGYLPAEKTILL